MAVPITSIPCPMEQSTVTTQSTKPGVSAQQGQQSSCPPEPVWSAHVPACLIVFNELPGVRHPKESLALDDQPRVEGNLYWVPLVTHHVLSKDTMSLPGFTFFAVQATAITNSWLNSKLTCWAVSTSVGSLASKLIISRAGRLESIPGSVGKHSLTGQKLESIAEPQPEMVLLPSGSQNG